MLKILVRHDSAISDHDTKQVGMSLLMWKWKKDDENAPQMKSCGEATFRERCKAAMKKTRRHI